jgi:hypothetical protein
MYHIYIHDINICKCVCSYLGFRGLAQPHIGGEAGAITLHNYKHFRDLGFRGLAQPHIGGEAGAITLHNYKHM